MKLSVKAPLTMAVVTVLLGLGFAVWLHLAMTGVVQGSARTSAMSQLRAASQAYSVTGTAPDFAAVDDPALPATLRQAARDGKVATYLDESPARGWAAMPTSQGGVLSVRTSWAEGASTLGRLDQNLALGVAGLAVVTALLALLTAYGLGRRLGHAERTARAIAEGDLTARVSERVTGRDEVAQLGRTIDALAASVQERIASEKRVTADIAHDLRTPVTGLVTAAALLPEGRPTEMVRGQVAKLWRLVEDLLEVARLDEAEQRLDLEEVSVPALARRCLAAVADVPVELVVEGDEARVVTDARRVERVVVNLVANAAAHGAPPVTCRVRGREIVVSDAGEGFPAELLDEGPRRFRTGALDRGSGHGLGLTIALGQARAVGARLVFANTGSGAEATLELPAAGVETLREQA